MRRKPRKNEDDQNGFAAWGGYMGAKKAKLSEQFSEVTVKQADHQSDIFKDVSILVNGYTKPGADELKLLMATHGGRFQLYQNQSRSTTHIIASNLPNVKINQLGNIPVVSPQWITDSVNANKLLDFKKYLLYTNHSRTQPKLNFEVVDREKCVSENQIVNQRNTESAQKYSKTASDPEFLSEFYNHSRLHLISTLGAEFKQLVNKLREESKGMFPGLERIILQTNSAGNSKIQLKSDTIVMHIDMDCFFVSVGIRNRPELQGKPIAVTHSKSGQSSSSVNRQIEIDLYAKRLPDGVAPRTNLIDDKCSMSEIASCSYEARNCGIKNGMFFGAALKLCPDLIPIPYDFQGYRDVSSILYRTIAEYTVNIEAVSCDEMYVDITEILKRSNLSIDDWAAHIRQEIITRTGCPCSTGFGANRLQARIATRKAKPNGQYYLEPEDVESYVYDLPLEDLPGVGWATVTKLNKLGLKTCGDIHNISLSTLKTELGQKNSETIYDMARGIDRRPLNYEHERKSVSAEVNYGIRFKNKDETLTFLESLSKEVHNRLSEVKMRSKTLTLKLLIRDDEAPKETAKYLGHGICNAISRSTTTNYYLDRPETIFKEAKILYTRLNVVDDDLRGVGIQLSKLEKISNKNKALVKFLNQPTKSSNTTVTYTDKIKENFENLQSNNNEGINTLDKEFKKNPEIVTSDKKDDNQNLLPKSNVIETKKGGASKRGRRKNNSSSVKTKTTSHLSNFFKSSKSSTSKQVNDKLCSIDINILKELPQELQDEIIKEYNLEQTMSQSSETNNEPSISGTSLPVTEAQEIPENNDVPSKKKGFADLSKEELKLCLKNWIKEEETPKDFDINMLGDFFKLLVEERKIEYLFSITNLLHRNLTEKPCIWHNAYFKLLNSFQETMLLTYGNTLLAPNSFSCCNST